VEAIEEVPHGAVLVFSATAFRPRFVTKPSPRLESNDATCPLVTKVHLEALKLPAKKRHYYLDRSSRPPEIVGTSGEAPDRTIVVIPSPLWMLLKSMIPESFRFTQTTLSLYDTQEIVARLRQKFPLIQAQRATTFAMPPEPPGSCRASRQGR